MTDTGTVTINGLVVGAVVCVQRLDGGAPLLTPPLVVSMSGSGERELLLTNSRGEISLFSTFTSANAGSDWNSVPREGGREFSVHQLSLTVSASEKQRLRNLELQSGLELTVLFHVQDNRKQQ
jgi:hypothetical protein